MKEIKVRLHHTDNGNYMEVWETRKNKKRKRNYFCRDTFGRKGWSYVCDAPYGYCERDYPVESDTVFIVCDKNWTALFKDGNAEEFEGFPSLETTCREQWAAVKERYPAVTRQGFGDWIVSKSSAPLSELDRLNWQAMWYRETGREVLHEFKHLNKSYSIYRVTQRHNKCAESWYEFFIGPSQMDKYDSYTEYLGSEYGDELSRTLTIRYIADPDMFEGVVVTTMRDGLHNDYGGETLEQLRERENNPNLQSLTCNQMNVLIERYEQKMQGPFEQITEERYYDLLECMPPLRWNGSRFFIREACHFSLHLFCFRLDGKYYSAYRSISLTDEQLTAQIKEFETH